MNECCPGITLEKFTKERLRELKNWYVGKGYSNTTIRNYKGNTRIEEVKKFYEVIGCHDARRTFVCCSPAFGIPPTVVMSCTGHSTYNAMKPYIEVADETQRVELAKWDKAEKRGDIKSDIAKKLEGVDEAVLLKVMELLKSA